MANVLINENSMTAIADAIRAKNGTQNTYKPAQMADAISAISGGGITPTGTKSITANGTYDVTNFASAEVNVPTGSTPTGTKEISITSNGTTTEDVSAYANAQITVNVPTGSSHPSEVPSGYTQLRYVESSGTQAINTTVAPTLETKFQVEGFVLSGNGSYYPLGGCTNPPITVGVLTSFDSGTVYNSFGNLTDKTIQNWQAPNDAPPILTIDKTSAIIVTGATKTLNLGATTMSGSSDTRIALFGRGNGGSIDRKSKARIYRAKIWENGTLIRDFVPAIEDSSEEVGMYDIVNNVFYRNVGTGAFTGGEWE